jgi:hypothetical protein
VRHANVGQQALNRRDLILFLAHLDMAQNEGGGDLEGATQVNRGTVGEMIEAAAPGFAVDRDDTDSRAPDLVGQNRGVDAEDPFQFSAIELLEDQAEGRVGRSAAPAQSEALFQLIEMDVHEGVDRPVAIRPGHDGQDRE